MGTMINELFRIMEFVWEALLHVWPLLLMTIPLAVIIKELNVSDKINNLFKKNIWLSILIATLIGAVSPFCSCGIIPVISALLIAGVPIAPIMAFWLASPSMDPEIFFLSVGSLGMPLAVARIMATFLMSIVGGVVTQILVGKVDATQFMMMNKERRQKQKKTKIQTGKLIPVTEIGIMDGAGMNGLCCTTLDSFESISAYSSEAALECASGCKTEVELKENGGCGCSENAPNIWWQHILKSTISSTWFVLKFLLIAYLLEALIIFYVPTEVVTSFFGNSPILSVAKATAIGIPLYTTNISALGLVSGLLVKGLSGGAGLAFLIGGATTTIPAMAAVYKLVDRRIFGIYILTTLTFAFLSGVIFNVFIG